MKADYTVRAQKFLDEIFPVIEKYLNDPYDLADTLFDYCAKKHERVQVRNGVSRWAVIRSDYVIKYDYNEDCWAGNCPDEVRKYAQAEEDGYAYLFAKITPVVSHNITFYIMPRIRNIGSHRDFAKALTEDEFEYICNVACDLHYHNYGWKDDKPVIVDYAFDP